MLYAFGLASEAVQPVNQMSCHVLYDTGNSVGQCMVPWDLSHLIQIYQTKLIHMLYDCLTTWFLKGTAALARLISIKAAAQIKVLAVL